MAVAFRRGYSYPACLDCGIFIRVPIKNLAEEKMKIEWFRSVRSLATIILIGTYCYLAGKGVIKPENFQSIIMAVIVFYFAAKNRGGGNDKNTGSGITGSGN